MYSKFTSSIECSRSPKKHAKQTPQSHAKSSIQHSSAQLVPAPRRTCADPSSGANDAFTCAVVGSGAEVRFAAFWISPA